jgi:hypothetical protein
MNGSRRSNDEIAQTIQTGSPAQKKALAKRLIVQVEIDGKVAYPKYRVPTAGVCIVGTLVGLDGLEPSTSRL